MSKSDEFVSPFFPATLSVGGVGRMSGPLTIAKIVDGQNIELIPSATLAVHSRIFQNREILDIFGKFRSSKTFVGRDQVREALFLK